MFYKKSISRNTHLADGSNMKENKLKKIVWFIMIMAICTSVSMLSHRFVWLEASIVMIYLLGILFISFLSQGYAYSFAASIFAILLYNYFFTEPYYTFKVDNPNYLITFTIMFIVGTITSMLTIRLKLETQMAEEREKYISSSYHFEKKLLNVKSKEDLGQISAEEISKTFGADVLVRFFDSNEVSIFHDIEGEDLFGGEEDMSAFQESFHSGSPCGNGTSLFSGAKGYYSDFRNSTWSVFSNSTKR